MGTRQAGRSKGSFRGDLRSLAWITVFLGVVVIFLGIAFAKAYGAGDFNTSHGYSTPGGRDHDEADSNGNHHDDIDADGDHHDDADADGDHHDDADADGDHDDDTASDGEPASLSNQPPVADAGPNQTVREGTLVTLDGSNSRDPDDGISTYAWTQVRGPRVKLSNPSAANPTFTAPDMEDDGAALIFRLTVTDTAGLSDTDTTIVNISLVVSGNLSPMADAGGDQRVIPGDTVTLDGSDSSDPDDGISTYAWTQMSGPSVTLSDPSAANPTFVAPAVGPEGATLIFQLTVTDHGGLKATDTCAIQVGVTATANEPPEAEAGEDQSVTPGDTVTLDGSDSSDPEGVIAAYAWRQLGGPSVRLSNPSAAETSFIAPDVDAGHVTLIFELTVTDDHGLKAKDMCEVVVNAVRREPHPDVKVNGQDGPVLLTPSDRLTLTISLEPGAQAGQTADWWVGVYIPDLGWFSLVVSEGWTSGIHKYAQVPLSKVLPKEILNLKLPAGDYVFFMALDDNADGLPDATWLDYVHVSVSD